MSRPQYQPRITNYLSKAMQIRSEPPRDASTVNGSGQRQHSQTQALGLKVKSHTDTSPDIILQPGQGQILESGKADSDTDADWEGSQTQDMEPQERLSLRSDFKKNSSTGATPRRAARTRDELRELAEIGDAAAAAELEIMRAKGRDSQKRRDERAAAGMPGAVASKEKDRQRKRDMNALRSSTAQLKEQIDNGDQGAVAALQMLQDGYLAKYPKTKMSIVSSLKLGNANIQVASGSLQSSKTQKQATKKPTKRKAIVDDEDGNKTKKQAPKKPAKRKAVVDDEEGNKTQQQATRKRTKRKLVVDDSENDDEDKTPKKRDAQPKSQEKLVVLPVQGEEAVTPKLRWHKGRTIRSSHNQHGQPSPRAASPEPASIAAPDSTNADVDTEAIVPEPLPTQIEEQPALMYEPERTTAAPTIQQPTTTPNIIDLDDTDVEFVESRPVFKNTPTNTMSSIYQQLGSFNHSRQQNDEDDDVEYTKLQIRKKEIEEEKIELQLKLRRQQRAQAVREVPHIRDERLKTELLQRDSAGLVGKVE